MWAPTPIHFGVIAVRNDERYQLDFFRRGYIAYLRLGFHGNFAKRNRLLARSLWRSQVELHSNGTKVSYRNWVRIVN